jgi:glycine C-acetyltransferase
MVDDAHATGVLGEGGRGTVDHFGLHGRVDIQVGTLSKAIGVLGGFIAGPSVLIRWLVNRGRPYLFSTSAPPAVVSACTTALDILGDEPDRLERLWSNTRAFKKELHALGLDTGDSETPITPVMAGGETTAQELSKGLWDEGVFAPAIVYPTVPRGKARVRTIVTADHRPEDLEQAIRAFGRVGHRLQLL